MVGAAWYYEENKDEDTTTTVTNTVITTNTNTISETNTNAVVNTNTASDINDVIRLSYLTSGELHYLDPFSGDTNILIPNASSIVSYNISKDGNYIVYIIQTSDTETEVHFFNTTTSDDSVILNESQASYHNVLISPNSESIAYLKKIYNNTDNLYLNQAIYYSNIDGTNETLVIGTGQDENSVKQAYSVNDPCSFSRDVNLLKLKNWAPESDFIVFNRTTNLECSGPAHIGINITDLNGTESFFDEFLPDPGSFTYNNNVYDWNSDNIFWPSFSTKNDNFLLEQAGPIPLVNRRVAIIDDGTIQESFNLYDYNNSDQQNNMQRVRSDYHYANNSIVWDEWINFSGNRWQELSINETIKIYGSSDNITVLMEASTDSAFTSPLIISDNNTLYKRYDVEQLTNDSNYTYNKKSDEYDLVNHNLTNGEQSVIAENVTYSNLQLYIQ